MDCTAECNERETWSEHIVYCIRKIKETDFVFTLFLVENFNVVCMCNVYSTMGSIVDVYLLYQPVHQHAA